MELIALAAVFATLVGLALLVKPGTQARPYSKRHMDRSEQRAAPNAAAPKPPAPTASEPSWPPPRSSQARPRHERPPEPAPDPPHDPPALRTDILLGCLGFLRYELGTDWSGVLEPFSVDPKDAIAVNEALKRLARHVGLEGLRFIVGIGRDGPEQGGHIELGTGQDEVFIEVSKAAGAFGPSLLAVLAHEVSHKVLFDRLIHQQGDDELRYELLTDVNAVYLGFGKLLLNGYEYATSKRGSESATWRKRHVRLGYLGVEEVAFVHAMACRMRELRSQDWYLGLSPHARRAMSRVVHDDHVRQLLDTAASLPPQKSYLRPPRRASVAAAGPAAAAGNRQHSRERPSPPRPPTSHTSPETNVHGAPSKRMPASPTAMSPEVAHLHESLLTLVYGDSGLARRLVELERHRHETVEARYKAAIERLVRDRS